MAIVVRQATANDLLFRGNKQISTIQNLYCQVWDNIMEHPYPDQNKTRKVFDDLMSKMEKEVDKVMPKPGSPNYYKFVAIKAYTHAFRACPFTGVPIKVDFLDTAFKLIKPIKLEKEGISTFIRVSQKLANYYCKQSDHFTAIMYLKEAEKAFEEFKAKFPDVNEVAFTEYDLFDAIKDSPLIEPKDLCTSYHIVTIVELFNHYFATDNLAMQLQYVIPSLRSRIIYAKLKEKLNFCTLVFELKQEITCLIQSSYFAQVNHILAGLMLKLVKLRRSSPEKDQPEIKKAQAEISEYFAHWAVEILRYSCEFDEHPKHPIKNEVVKIPELIEEGIEVYENQFPCEPILDPKTFEKSLKRGKNWCKRAIELGKDPNHVVIKGFLDLLNLMDMIKVFS